MSDQVSFIPGASWFQVKDADPRASALFKRHYSCKQYQDGRRYQPQYRNRHHIMGPGEKMILITTDGRALFGWRKFINKDDQQGINCSVFRNEGPHLSSNLILEAEQLAQKRWPGERMYTYVDPDNIASTNPGYCFKMAGWNICGRTQHKNLIILEKLP